MVSDERRKQVREAYIAALNKEKWAFEFVKDLKNIDHQLIAIKYRTGLPSEIMAKLHEFAQSFGTAVNATVTLYPEEFDIKAIPRAEAVKWLKDLARGIGCEVLDPAEPFAFPKLSSEKMQEVRQAIANSPPATMTTLEEASYRHGQRLGQRLATAVTRGSAPIEGHKS